MSVKKIGKSDNCCGCIACVEVCPKKCISKKKNKEGFFYSDVDDSICIECGLCEKVCPSCNPIIDAEELRSSKKNTYIGYAKDDIVRAFSSSGGMFSILAQKVLEQGGIVYGAAFDRLFKVKHERVDSSDELENIVTSKYVQSDMEGTYSKIEKDLRLERKVLFCGTPCQVAAVYHYAKRKGLLSHLILVDFICHGVPSPQIWQSYVDYIEKRLGGNLLKVSFRDKSRGWHDFSFVAVAENGKSISESHDINAYMQTFLSDKNIRSSCYSCMWKSEGYFSDITLGDAWKIEKEKLEWADDKGTSLIICRSVQGQSLIDEVSELLLLSETSYQQWCEYNPSIIFSTDQHSERTSFFMSALSMESNKFWNQQRKIPAKKRIKYWGKCFAKTVGLEKIIRAKS